MSQHLSRRNYTIGYLGSLLLTVLAYGIVRRSSLVGWSLVYGVAGLALLQLSLQLVMFLHIGEERSPRWRLMTLLYTVFAASVVIFGTIWIMQNLNYHGRTPEETSKYLIKDEGYRN